MYHDLPPTDTAFELVMERAKELTQLPRSAVIDVCPVCSKPIVIRHGHAVCESGMCRGRVLEGCCGE